MLPLTMASQGEPMTIKKIGGKQETKKFLETLVFNCCHIFALDFII